MISANQLRSGMTIEVDGELYTVVEFQHVKPGKGGAFVRTKLKALKSGVIVDKTFRAEEKIPQAIVETKKMQFLYKEGDAFWFMDEETYEQIAVSKDTVGEKKNFLSEGAVVDLLFYKEKVIGIELPTAVDLRVVKTEPGVRGDTATSPSKPATLETGLTVQVPLFIKEGDIIRIDTRSSTYVSKGG